LAHSWLVARLWFACEGEKNGSPGAMRPMRCPFWQALLAWASGRAFGCGFWLRQLVLAWVPAGLNPGYHSHTSDYGYHIDNLQKAQLRFSLRLVRHSAKGAGEEQGGDYI